MHVIKIRDKKGDERIYAAKLLKRDAQSVTFSVADGDLTVRTEDVLDMTKV